MKRATILLFTLPMLLTTAAWGEDIREAARTAAADRAAALQEADEAEARILNDRAALTAEVERLEGQHAVLEREITLLEGQIAAFSARRERLSEEWSHRELEFREISGNVRVTARELEAILSQSLTSAMAPDRAERLKPLLAKGYFPDIDDIAAMVDLFFDEMRRTGEVAFARDCEFVDRAGELRDGQVLTLGAFTAVYRADGEAGFLQYVPAEQRLFALQARPGLGTQRKLKRYLDGKSESVPVDFSSGAALRQLTHRTSLLEQLRAGGPIIWPILAIAVVAIFIVIERILFLNRVRGDTDRLLGAVNDLAAQGDWDGCTRLADKYQGRDWPVVSVIRAGLAARHEERETLESVLQEAILRELPRLERFLSGLSIMGAVAPLLGLLGTVTGMIETFRVITLHGTGDPKLMSGGISEALVTTELGLAVAIPIMLLHTYLSRRVDHIVGDMEEKAVTLTNVIQKEQRREAQGV